MTDQVDLPEPQWDGEESWDMSQPGPAFQAPPAVNYTPTVDTRSEHNFTLGISVGRPPSVTVRADTVADALARWRELANAGVFAAMADAEQQLQQAKAPVQQIQQQLGATPIGQYPNPQPGYGQPLPPANQGQPPFGAPPGGYTPPAQQGWGAGAPGTGGVDVPSGWYQVKIPFSAKAEGDALKAQLQASGLRQGNMRWDGDGKRWLVSPAIVQYFAKWNPMPA